MTDNPNDPNPKDPTAGEKAPEPGKEEAKFTQADIDRAVKDRITREKAKYADYDDLKAKAQKQDEAEANAKTETQKLVEKADKAEREKSDAISKANDRIITAELRAQAASMGFTDLDYAVFKVKAKVTLADDGSVEGAAEALAELAKASPALVKKPGQAALNAGNPGGAGSGETDAQKRARIYGTGGGIFDQATSNSLGGGVFMNTDPNKQP